MCSYCRRLSSCLHISGSDAVIVTSSTGSRDHEHDTDNHDNKDHDNDDHENNDHDITDHDTDDHDNDDHDNFDHDITDHLTLMTIMSLII